MSDPATEWVELWAELCDRNGLTLLATDLRRLHARDGDEQEQGRQADGNNNGSASARASAGNGARGTKATPSVVAPGRPVTLAPWLDKLPKAIRWRRDIKAVNGVEAIVNFDFPEYDEDSDEMSRKSRATMYDARTSGVWTGVSMPSFFSERVKPMDDELASLPLGQQLLQEARHGFKMFAFFSKYNIRQEQTALAATTMTFSVDRPAILQVVTSNDTEATTMYGIFVTESLPPQTPIRQSINRGPDFGPSGELKWLFVELLSCAIVTLPSGSPSPLFVITMANAQAGFRSRSASHVDTGSHSGNRSRSASHVGGSSSYSALSMLGSSMSTSYISKFYAENTNTFTAFLAMLNDRFPMNPANADLRTAMQKMQENKADISNVLAHMATARQSALEANPRIEGEFLQARHMDEAVYFERQRLADRLTLVELSPLAGGANTSIDRRFYYNTVIGPYVKGPLSLPTLDFAPSEFSSVADAKFSLHRANEKHFGRCLIIRALDLLMAIHAPSDLTIEQRFSIAKPIVDELALRHNVSDSFVTAIECLLLAHYFEHTVSHIRLAIHLLQQLVDDMESVRFTLQEFATAKEIVQLFGGHVKNWIVQMRHLFPKQMRQKAVAGLVTMLELALRISSILKAEGLEVSLLDGIQLPINMQTTMNLILTTCVQASVLKGYESIVEGVMEQSNMSDLQRMSGLLSPRQLLMVLSDLLKEADSYHVIIDHSLNPFFSDWNLVVTEFFNVFVRDVARCLEAILDKSMTFEAVPENNAINGARGIKPQARRNPGSSTSESTGVLDPSLFKLMHQMLVVSRTWAAQNPTLPGEWQRNFVGYLTEFLNSVGVLVDKWVTAAIQGDTWSPVFLYESSVEPTASPAGPASPAPERVTTPSVVVHPPAPPPKVVEEDLASSRTSSDSNNSQTAIARSSNNNGNTSALMNRFLNTRSLRPDLQHIAPSGDVVDSGRSVSPGPEPVYTVTDASGHGHSYTHSHGHGHDYSDAFSAAGEEEDDDYDKVSELDMSETRRIKLKPSLSAQQQDTYRVWLPVSSSLVDTTMLVSLLFRHLYGMAVGLSIVTETATDTNVLGRVVCDNICHLAQRTCARYVNQITERTNKAAIPSFHHLLLSKLENLSPQHLNNAWVAEIVRSLLVPGAAAGGQPASALPSGPIKSSAAAAARANEISSIDHVILARICVNTGNLEALLEIVLGLVEHQKIVQERDNAGVALNALHVQLRDMIQTSVYRHYHSVAIYIGELVRSRLEILLSLELPGKSPRERLQPVFHFLNGGLSSAALYLSPTAFQAVVHSLWALLMAILKQISVVQNMEILDRWQLLVDTYMLLLELFEELKVPRSFLVATCNEGLLFALMNTLSKVEITKLGADVAKFKEQLVPTTIGVWIEDVERFVQNSKGSMLWSRLWPFSSALAPSALLSS